MLEQKTNIQDDYRFLSRIGNGAFTDVFLVEHRVANQKLCVNALIRSAKNDYSQILKEIKLLKEMDHPQIVKIL